MKRFLFGFIFLFFLFPNNAAFAQFPSFEIYSRACGAGKNCTPYPAVESANVSKLSGTIIVTARIFDVSGVLVAVANIEDPKNPGFYMNSEYPGYGDGIMYDDGSHGDGATGDGIYGAIFDVSDNLVWNHNAIYWIDISATDRLLNNSTDESSGRDYNHAGKFTLNADCAMFARSNNADICLETLSSSSFISQNTVGQLISSFIFSSKTNSLTLTATLPASASGETVYFVLVFTSGSSTTTATGSAAVNSSGKAIFIYSTTSKNFTAKAIYLGNPIKGFNPSIRAIDSTGKTDTISAYVGVRVAMASTTNTCSQTGCAADNNWCLPGGASTSYPGTKITILGGANCTVTYNGGSASGCSILSSSVASIAGAANPRPIGPKTPICPGKQTAIWSGLLDLLPSTNYVIKLSTSSYCPGVNSASGNCMVVSGVNQTCLKTCADYGLAAVSYPSNGFCYNYAFNNCSVLEGLKGSLCKTCAAVSSSLYNYYDASGNCYYTKTSGNSTPQNKSTSCSAPGANLTRICACYFNSAANNFYFSFTTPSSF